MVLRHFVMYQILAEHSKNNFEIYMTSHLVAIELYIDSLGSSVDNNYAHENPSLQQVLLRAILEWRLLSQFPQLRRLRCLIWSLIEMMRMKLAAGTEFGIQ